MTRETELKKIKILIEMYLKIYGEYRITYYLGFNDMPDLQWLWETETELEDAWYTKCRLTQDEIISCNNLYAHLKEKVRNENQFRDKGGKI